ncbi:hypothetical protein Tco_0577975 [Tanacetum coccineum]
MWSCEKIFNPIDTLTQHKELFLVVDATRAIPTMKFLLPLFLVNVRVCGRVSGFGIGEVVLCTYYDVIVNMFVFFLQMGFTLILATLDGLDVCLLRDVIGEDDGDEGADIAKISRKSGHKRQSRTGMEKINTRAGRMLSKFFPDLLKPSITYLSHIVRFEVFWFSHRLSLVSRVALEDSKPISLTKARKNPQWLLFFLLRHLPLHSPSLGDN